MSAPHGGIGVWLALVAGATPEVRLASDGAVWVCDDGGWRRVLPPLPPLPELELDLVELPPPDPDDPEAAERELRRVVDEAEQDRARALDGLRAEVDGRATAQAWFDAEGLWVVRADGGWFSPDRGLTWVRRRPSEPPAPPPVAAPWALPRTSRRWWPTLSVDLTWYRHVYTTDVTLDRAGWFDATATLRWDLARRGATYESVEPYEAAGRVWVGDDPLLAAAVSRWTAARAADQRRRSAEWWARRRGLDAERPPQDLRSAVWRELERQELDARLAAAREG